MVETTSPQPESRVKARDLTCGCCGAGFYTWPTYRDQDQDAGFGICRDCQAWAHREDRAQQRRAFDLVRSALNPENRAQFDGFKLPKKRWIVAKLYERGHLKWSITRH